MNKISQLTVAAPGWVARFEEEDGSMSDFRVAVWAVAQSTYAEDCIVGFSEGEDFLSPDCEASNFKGYFFVGPAHDPA